MEGLKYDVIIIGAGSSGAACAKALEASNKKILLIEAGNQFPPNEDEWKKPNQWMSTLRYPNFHWGEAENEGYSIKKHHFSVHRAKVGGGCSAHNAMIFMTGTREDLKSSIDSFGSAEVELGLLFESVEAVLPSAIYTVNEELFQQNTFYSHFHSETYRIHDLLNVDINEESTSFHTNFKYLIDANFNRVTPLYSFNNSNNNYDCNIKDEITYQPNTLCKKIIFNQEKDKVIGVEVLRDALTETLYLEDTGYLVCCAGSIHTPILLSNSGVYDDSKEFFFCEDLFVRLKFSILCSLDEIQNLELFSVFPPTVFYKVEGSNSFDCSIQFEKSKMLPNPPIKITKRQSNIVKSSVNANVVVSGLDFKGKISKSTEENDTKWIIEKREDDLSDADRQKIVNATLFAVKEIRKKLSPIIKKRIRNSGEEPSLFENISVSMEDGDDEVKQKIIQLMESTDVKNKITPMPAHHCCGTVDTNDLIHISNLIISDSSVIKRPCSGYTHAPAIGLGYFTGNDLKNKINHH